MNLGIWFLARRVAKQDILMDLKLPENRQWTILINSIVVVEKNCDFLTQKPCPDAPFFMIFSIFFYKSIFFNIFSLYFLYFFNIYFNIYIFYNFFYFI